MENSIKGKDALTYDKTEGFMSEVEKSAGNSFDHSSQCGCLCGMCGVWE